MSRKLDKLFADRVLGGKYEPILVEDDLVLKENMEAHLKMHFEVPRYTRSLDAVWEGAVKSKHFTTFHVVFDEKGDGIGAQAMEASARRRGEGHCPARSDYAAEALVLACLRAVGVSEAEIEEARKA